MLVDEAQKEVRTAFMGGFIGQLVAGIIWRLSSASSIIWNPRMGMIILFFVNMFLFPITQLILKLIGRPAKLNKNNKLNQLAMQVAFIVPIGFLLVAAATLYNENWFYPASMIIVGVHYFPFIFLYGMPQFGFLAGILIFGGTGIGMYYPNVFSLGGWFSSVIFIIFSFILLLAIKKEESIK